MGNDNKASEVMEVFIKQQEERISELSRQLVILSTKNKMLEDKNDKLVSKLKSVTNELKKVSNSQAGAIFYSNDPQKRKNKLNKDSELAKLMKEENKIEGGFVHSKTKVTK